jgi:drug/metabolite transporter (DMT)-like permease
MYAVVMERRPLALLALFVVNLIYGVNYVVAKGLMPQVIGPSGFILLRAIGAVLLFWLVRAFRPERVAMQDVVRLVLCAVFGVALNQLMFFQGLMRTSPIHASVIMLATPILVLVGSGVLLGERITLRKLNGVAFGMAGALGIIFVRAPEGVSSPVGDLFILINAASFAIYLVMVKPLMKKYTAITIMSWSFLVGALLIVPFGAGELAAVRWEELTTAQVGAMAFVVVMVTFVAYLLNTWALRHVEASVVGSFIYVQPILAMVISVLYARYGESLIGRSADYVEGIGWFQWLCAAMIFLGVHLVTRKEQAAGSRQ